MKKTLKLIAVFFAALFVLLGCGKEESSSFELNQNGVNSVLTYYYNNDLVTKQTATNTYDLKQLGVTATVESKDGFIIQTLTVDYSVAKLSELKAAFPHDFTGSGEKVSFKVSKEALINAGYAEKK